MTFTPIASSSAGNAYVLSAPGLAPLLIDCGVGIDVIRQALGFKTTDLAGCLISHSHGDHCKSATALARVGVELYFSAETFKELVRKGFEFAHRSNVLLPKTARNIEGWDVMGFEVVHDCPGTFGFLVKGGGGILLYLTDTAYSPFTFPGVTHYAVEANFDADIMRANSASGSIDSHRFKRTTRNHMSIERLVDMLKANDMSAAKEIHLLHLSDQNSDADAFKEAVARATGVPVFIAPRVSPAAFQLAPHEVPL